MAFCSNCKAALPEGAQFCAQCGRPIEPFNPPAADSPLTQPGIPANVAGGLCYFFVLAIVFLVLEPYNRDRFVRFHAFQSIFFTIAAIVATTIAGMIPLLNILLAPLVWAAAIAVWALLIIQAFMHRTWKLPVIGDFADKQV
jgi:uncharacterized membrane protein